MRILQAFSFLLLMTLVECQHCRDLLKFSSCNQKGRNRRMVYYPYYERLKVINEKSCIPKKIEWSYYSFSTAKKYWMPMPKFGNRLFVTLPKFRFKPGRYTIGVNATFQSGSMTRRCDFMFDDKPPIIIFKRGLVQFVLPLKPFEIDLTTSLIPKGRELVMKTSCRKRTLKMCKKNKACDYKDMRTGLQKTHGLTYMVDGLNRCDMYVKFTAVLPSKSGLYNESITIYRARKLSMSVILECVSNCPAAGVQYTNPHEPVVMQTVCTEKCEKFDKIFISWSISSKDDTLTKSEFTVLRKGKELVIHKNELKTGMNYQVKATGSGNSFATMVYITTWSNSIHIKCDVNPTSGISLDTRFYFKCNLVTVYDIDRPPVFSVRQILAENPRKEVLLLETARDEFYVVLGVDKDVINKKIVEITAINVDNAMPKVDVGALTVKVKEASNEAVSAAKKSIVKLEKVNDLERAMQKMLCAFRMLKDKKISNETRSKFKKEAIRALESMAEVNWFQFKSGTSMLALITEMVDPEDVKYRKKLSPICQQFVNAAKQFEQQMSDEFLYQDDIKESFSKVQKCAAYSEKKTKEEEEKKRVHDIKRTPQEGVHEDYKNYDDLTNDPKLTVAYQKAIDTTLAIGIAEAKALQAGHNKTSNAPNIKSFMIAAEAEVMAGKNVSTNTTDVIVGEDVASRYAGKVVTVKVTEFLRSAMEDTTHYMQTNMVDVNVLVHEDNGDVIHGNSDMTIIFKEVNDTKSFESYTTNADLDSYLCNFELNVHRLDLVKGAKCYIKFYNMPNDALLKVFISKDKRPSCDDIKNLERILNGSVGANQTFPCPYQEDWNDDHLVYVAVWSPKKDTDYSVQFSYQMCITYNNLEKWKAAGCKVHFTYFDEIPHMTCECLHNSLFAGINKITNNRLDTLLLLEVVPLPFVSYVIFFLVVGVFVCFCIALMFLKFRTPPAIGLDKVIFLSDNRKNDMYCYLIVIKTGYHSDAGTTSNVMIKLYGTKAESMSHVLNYPDPEKRLLQRNKYTWFALTTPTHLGDLVEIELWTDCIGYRPNWSCDSVEIIDVQTEESFWFNVNKRFSVLEGEDFTYRIPAGVRNLKPPSVSSSLLKYGRFHFNGENTWNIFHRAVDTKLPYHRRLTIILSVIYTTYFFVVLLIHPPEMRERDAFGIGSMRLDQTFLLALASSLLSTIINFPFVYIYRNAGRVEDIDALITYPFKFSDRTRTWTSAIMAVWVACCMAYLLTFGFSVPMSNSIIWLYATTFSIVMSAFLTENLFFIVLRIIESVHSKVKVKRYQLAKIVEEIEEQRKVLFRQLGELLLRPYFKFHYYKMSINQQNFRKLKQRQQESTRKLFREMMMYSIFLLVLYFTVFSFNSPMIAVYNRHMRTMVSGHFNDAKMRIEDVHSYEGIKQFLSTTVVQIMNVEAWYGDYRLNDTGLMLDFNTKIIGVARVRQQLMLQECMIPRELADVKFACDNDVPKVFEVTDYLNGSEGSDYLGVLKKYSSEGYRILLGRTRHNTEQRIADIVNADFVNINTKAVFVEFCTYNPNVNLFNAVRLVFEKDVSGHVVPSVGVYTFDVIAIGLAKKISALSCQILYIIMLTVMASKCFLQVIRERQSFFTNRWNVFDMSYMMMAACAFVLYSYNFTVSTALLKEMVGSKRNVYIDFFHYIRLIQISRMLTASLMFFGTIKLWKYLRFRQLFQVMEDTLRLRTVEFFSILLMQSLVFFMFGAFFHLLVGPQFFRWQGVHESLVSIFLASQHYLPGFEASEFEKCGTLCYFPYSVFMVAAVMFYSLYCTIVIGGFMTSKVDHSKKKHKYNIGDYVRDELRYKAQMTRRHFYDLRLSAGTAEDADAVRLVEEKADAKRHYQAAGITDTRLSLMRYIAAAVIRNRNCMNAKGRPPMTEDDYRLMALVVLNYYLDRVEVTTPLLKKQLFYRTTDPATGRPAFVSNNKLLQMEYVAETMLKHGSLQMESDVITVSGDSDRLRMYLEQINTITRVLDHIYVVIKKRPQRRD